jgi:hypothetical protein
MRASLALACAALAVGCNGGQTALLVTVEFDDASFQPTALAVTVSVPARTLRMDVPVAASGRAIRSGDSFAVLLADDLDGQLATVEVEAPGVTPPLAGSGQQTIARDRVVPLTVHLLPTVPTGDLAGASDGGVGDLAVADLAPSPDLTPPRDLASPPDRANADLACIRSTSCAAGVETSTCGATTTMRPCAFGCGGAACLRPDGCAAPGDVSAGGVFADSTAGFTDDATGSCGGAGGADAVTVLTLPTSWRTVTLDTLGSSFDTILYSRLACGSPTELPLAGPCPGAASAGTACNAPVGGTAQLVLCNLPPGVPIYTWLDGHTLVGGDYRLTVTLGAPSSLNTCPEAGNLLDGAAGRTFSASTAGHANNFSTVLTCGDGGVNSPDAVFFLAVPVARTVTFTTQAAFRHQVYVRSACVGPDVACSPSGATNSATVTHALSPGVWFVVVDGQSGASGAFTLAVQ